MELLAQRMQSDVISRLDLRPKGLNKSYNSTYKTETTNHQPVAPVPPTDPAATLPVGLVSSGHPCPPVKPVDREYEYKTEQVYFK